MRSQVAPAIQASFRQRSPRSIGQVYDAFNPTADRAYRRAMEVSVGGVVQSRDLLHAMEELAPQALFLARLVNVCALPRPIVQGEVPLVNAPALRTVLFTAFSIALSQAPNPPCITPEILAASLAISLRRVHELGFIFDQLHLVVPAEVASDIGRHSANNTGYYSPLPKSEIAVAQRVSVEEVVAGWLATQTSASKAEQQNRLQSLAVLAGHC